MQIRDEITEIVEILRNTADDAILAMEEAINLVVLEKAWIAYRTVVQIADQIEEAHIDVCVLPNDIADDAFAAYNDKLNEFFPEEKEDL